ncbi:hypothetical protein BCV72DRAFT_218098, partial [Rhizopus microsporus var. microsporus]
LQDNIKRFKRDLQRYNSKEWLTPERINKSLYNELQKRKVGANEVINEIYKLTETTRQQTKAAIEIYEQLTHVLEIIEGGQDPRSLLNRAQTQSHRLAIFGLLQGKLQGREAKIPTAEALNMPTSVQHLLPKREDSKSNDAFSDEFMQQYHQAIFERDLLQRNSFNNNRGRGYGQFSRGKNGNSNSRGGYRGSRRRGHFLSQGHQSTNHQAYYSNNNNNEHQNKQ